MIPALPSQKQLKCCDPKFDTNNLMETKESQELLQSRLSFFHLGWLFSSDRDDSSDSDDYLETGLYALVSLSLHNMDVIGWESRQRDLDPGATSDFSISLRFIENSNAEFPVSYTHLTLPTKLEV